MKRLWTAVLAMAFALPAHATLITSDWLAEGDGLLIRDTLTNIEWLRFDAVVGNHLEVAAKLETDYDGFRFANEVEFEELVRTYIPGLTPSAWNSGTDPVIADALAGLRSTLHYTDWQLMTCRTPTGCPVNEGGFAGTGVRRHLMGFRESDGGYFFFFNDDNTLAAQQVLVRVPEPASVALFLAGLLGVGVITRRGRSRARSAS